MDGEYLAKSIAAKLYEVLDYRYVVLMILSGMSFGWFFMGIDLKVTLTAHIGENWVNSDLF